MRALFTLLTVALVAAALEGAATLIEKHGDALKPLVGSTFTFRGPYKPWNLPSDIGLAPGQLLTHLDKTHRANDAGYHGPLTATPTKTPAARRPPNDPVTIAILGDSMTFGFGVEPHEAWPAQLETLLNDAPLGARYHVLNFAIPGYDTFLETQHYAKNVAAFAPDLVLVGFFGNDAILDRHAPNIYRTCNLPLAPAERAIGVAVELSSFIRITHDLTTWFLYRYPGVEEDYGKALAPTHTGFQCALHHLTSLRDLVEAQSRASQQDKAPQHAPKFAVALLPYFQNRIVAGNAAREDPEEQGFANLRQCLSGTMQLRLERGGDGAKGTICPPRDNPLKTLDLREKTLAVPFSDLPTLMLSDTHPNPAGHALLARAAFDAGGAASPAGLWARLQRSR